MTETMNNHQHANGVYSVLTAGNCKPILFSTPMVKAILRGEKTQTRRIVKYSKNITDPKIGFSSFTDNDQFEVRGVHENGQYGSSLFKMKYKVGDILWVRETWQHTRCLNINHEDENYGFVYKADEQPWEDYEGWTWKPSIFMPKDACRIFLNVTKIRIERLQDITDSDIVKEGAAAFGCCTKRLNWQILWKKINGVESWKENPWVFVYEFERTDASFACR
jgi:hypothetical protein